MRIILAFVFAAPVYYSLGGFDSPLAYICVIILQFLAGLNIKFGIKGE